jgi:hypothetical protein
MLATLPRRRRCRQPSAQTIRRLLLEIAYRVHATKVVRLAPAGDGRERLGGRLPSG